MPKLDSIEAVKQHFDWAPYSKERWATHNLSSLNLIPFVNERNPKLVIDIGCGKNNFKGLIPNLIGLDVSDYPEADFNMSLEEVYNRNIFQHGCADVVMALGSLNFGTFDNIISQFGMAIDWVKPGGIFIVRVRLHLDKEEAFHTRGHQQHNWNWENVDEMHEAYKDKVEYLIEPALEKAAGGLPEEKHGEPDFGRPPVDLAVWTWIKK